MTISAQATAVDNATFAKFAEIKLRAQIQGASAMKALNSQMGQLVAAAMADPTFANTQAAQDLKKVIAKKIKDAIDSGTLR